MTDIPFRLLISAVLTSLMVPLVISAYDDLSDRTVAGRMESELSRIAQIARAVLDADPGSSLTVTADLRG